MAVRLAVLVSVAAGAVYLAAEALEGDLLALPAGLAVALVLLVLCTLRVSAGARRQDHLELVEPRGHADAE